MSFTTTVTFNGTTYTLALTGAQQWGTYMELYLAALAAGAAGKSVSNTFLAQQVFNLGVALVPEAAPAQTANGQLFTGTDGNLYALAASPNAPVPVQLTAATPVGTPGYIIKTSAYIILPADGGAHFVTTGASSAVPFTLPTPATNLEYTFTCTAAQTLTVSGAASSVVGPSTTVGTTVSVFGAVAGNEYTTFKLSCFDGTHWLLSGVFGSAVVS